MYPYIERYCDIIQTISPLFLLTASEEHALEHKYDNCLSSRNKQKYV